MKSKFLGAILLTVLSVNSYAQGSFSDLFKNPYPTASVTSQGASGGAVAGLAEGCKKMKNALMPYTTLFNLQFQYGFHAHLLAIDMAKAAAGSPPFFTPWFNLAIPGVSGSQEDPLIMKMCDILIQFDNYGILKGSFATAQFLNNMTGGQFNAELTVVDKLNNAALSVYDFNNGQVRKGALRSGYVHKQLIDAAGATKKLWEQKSGKPDAQGFESEAQRKQQLSKVAELAYQKSTLEDSMKCPVPTDNKNYQAQYSQMVLPREAEIRRLNGEIDFYYKKLLEMGKDMTNDRKAVIDYNKVVNELVHRSVIFTPRKSTFKQKNTKYTAELDANGKPIKKTENISKPIYLYTSNINVEIFDNFKKKYVTQWEKYISSQMLVSGSFGLMDGKKGRLEEKYRSYSEECSENRLANQLPVQDKNDPRYFSELTKERENCRSKLKIREAEFKNIMESYVHKLDTALAQRARNQTEIWNYEAESLGRVRILKDSTNSRDRQEADDLALQDVQAQEVSCSTELTPAEMDNLDLKLDNVNLALKQQWAEMEVKESVNQDIEREGKYRATQEAKKKDEMDQQRIRNIKESGSGNAVNIRPDTSGSL